MTEQLPIGASDAPEDVEASEFEFMIAVIVLTSADIPKPQPSTKACSEVKRTRELEKVPQNPKVLSDGCPTWQLSRFVVESREQTSGDRGVTKDMTRFESTKVTSELIRAPRQYLPCQALCVCVCVFPRYNGIVAARTGLNKRYCSSP